MVVKKFDENENKESLKKSEYIICPIYKEYARINIYNYMINIFWCKNGHKENKIPIKNYKKIQNYNEAEIKCEICKKSNKCICYYNIFYICLECKKNYVLYAKKFTIKIII